MEPAAQILIISGSPIMAHALQGLLMDAPTPWRSQVLTDLDGHGAESAPEADILLLAPQHWEEFSRWLPGLRQGYASQPWLLLAEPRMAGMFLPHLDSQLCALVALNGSPEELWSRLGALMDARGACLRHELLARFSRGRSVRDGAGRTPMPTLAELQCGCAVSMGLGNRQIAELLHLAETTVKSHVHHLLRKLNLADRSELRGYVQHALTPRPPPAMTPDPEAAWKRRSPTPGGTGWA